ncbi:hypothetical protein L6164_035604 [Bauhinia variegata]|uniref:Uncharacterized protein n=1 Tax=Bauhinia variegata TaxID=167791 RepID=A0ACB9KEL7_BAUVA|nr:hypothetical protein L6164_035604 [Bauhinia variegata]
MHEIKWGDASFKQFKFMDAIVSTHRRSNSDPMKRRVKEVELDIFKGSYLPNTEKEMAQLKESNEYNTRQFYNIDHQSYLTQEIVQLQQRLQQQYVVRRALEKACFLPFSQDTILENSIPEAAKELIKEIGVLELQVVYLEQYLLSLYRQRFGQQISSISDNDRRLKSVSDVNQGTCAVPGRDNNNVSENEISVKPTDHVSSPRNSAKECNNQLEPETVLDSSIHRSHSTLSQRSVCLIETSSMKAKAADSYHSLPLSVLETRMANTSANCLAEHLGTCFSEDVPETPNWLSEEMIKSILAIYCELADPPFTSHDNVSSPISFSSSVYEDSSQGQGNRGRSQGKKLSSLDSHFNIPFHFKGTKEFSGPYCSMVKIHRICRDNEKLKEVEYMLRRFRSLVSRLQEVDPRKMKHEEKLAFWINVHNALVMHALLIYGIPTSNLKRMSSVLKAAYNIGGHTVSVDMIQNFILGCRLPRPGQWLRLLFLPKTKSKVRDARKAYAIDRPEPLVLFALCSGSYSDPAVRLYTPKTVLEELESAKEEYILSTMSVTKEQKILVPKMVDFFIKDSGLGPAGLMEMVEPYVPESQRRIIHQLQQKAKWKGIEFIPHNFNFHYLVLKELAW